MGATYVTALYVAPSLGWGVYTLTDLYASRKIFSRNFKSGFYKPPIFSCKTSFQKFFPEIFWYFKN